MRVYGESLDHKAMILNELQYTSPTSTAAANKSWDQVTERYRPELMDLFDILLPDS